MFYIDILWGLLLGGYEVELHLRQRDRAAVVGGVPEGHGLGDADKVDCTPDQHADVEDLVGGHLGKDGH